MNGYEQLKFLKSEVEGLQYREIQRSDELTSKAQVLIDKFFNSKPSYLGQVRPIKFDFIGLNTGKNEDKKKVSWNRGKDRFLNLINTLLYDLELSENMSEKEKVIIQQAVHKTKIFIVHGHDNEAKTEVARFIERFGLEAIILHEQVNSGATIIEKLERHTDVGFAIVIYTACDIGAVKTKPDELKLRARQNVVFEHGLMIGKIGRENVVALVKDDVEIPNDISGVVYESMDSKGAWRLQLAKEMRASGYKVDMDKV